MSDVDILKLDRQIKDMFDNERKKLPQYKKQLHELKNVYLQNSKKNSHKRRSSVDWMMSSNIDTQKKQGDIQIPC